MFPEDVRAPTQPVSIRMKNLFRAKDYNVYELDAHLFRGGWETDRLRNSLAIVCCERGDS